MPLSFSRCQDNAFLKFHTLLFRLALKTKRRNSHEEAMRDHLCAADGCHAAGYRLCADTNESDVYKRQVKWESIGMRASGMRAHAQEEVAHGSNDGFFIAGRSGTVFVRH